MGDGDWDIHRYIVFQCYPGIKETNDSNNRGQQQHIGIETQPGKIQANFNTEIFLNVVKGLITIPFTKRCPM